MKGADYIAEFLSRRHLKKIFLVTGGSCAFIIDSIARHPELEYICFQHEQAASMAADAVWRVDHKTVGVTVATSGPGATNLITGIGCSYFDSIPSIHITGQVNKRESSIFLGANVRQAGFQETDIVSMVKSITKYAVQVNTVDELKEELDKAYHIAISGRMGPVLIDIPMNIQQEDVGDIMLLNDNNNNWNTTENPLFYGELKEELRGFFEKAERPLILFGAGVGLANVETEVIQWLEKQQLPFVSSWNGMTYFDHDSSFYYGQIGVYGNRGSNFILQNCDALLVIGSRLDNRQRSGDSRYFAPDAKVHVIDIDAEELKKYSKDSYAFTKMNLRELPFVLENLEISELSSDWRSYIAGMKEKYFGKDISGFSKKNKSMSPYKVVQRINQIIDNDSVVIAETGACLCWVFQIFHRKDHTLFTAGGMSPMGYGIPASIGAALTSPSKQIVCFVGDGGCQMNIQELQTIKNYNLEIKIVVLNNSGYGMIKQFQDSYLGGRYEATGNGYSHPNFKNLAKAYEINYKRIETVDDITKELFASPGAILVDIILHPGSLIEPKLEMGRPINDQFPYMNNAEFKKANRFVRFKRFKNGEE